MKLLSHKNLLIFISLFFIISFSYINFEKTTQSIDETLKEYFFKIRGEIKTSNNITIINIDEKSIKALGQWPFSRDYLAQVLINLSNSNAGIIGLDIVFSEEDRSSPSNMAKLLNLKGEFQNNDELLGLVVSKTPTILGYFFSNDKEYENLKPINFSGNFIYKNSALKYLVKPKGIVKNIKAIRKDAYSSGFFNAFNEKHGKINKMALILNYQDNIYPSLAFEMIRVASGNKDVQIISDEFGLKALKLDTLSIPVNKNGFFNINFRGAKNSFKYISFVDILTNNFDKKDIEGKFILIGTSATTLADLRATVFDLSLPGVEIHANIIDNILKQDFIYEDENRLLYDIFSIFLFTVILSFILLRLNAFYNLFFLLFIFSTSTYVYYILLFDYGLILNLFYPLLCFILTTLISIIINYQKEQKQKKLIKDIFSKKVSNAVVSDLLNKKDEAFSTNKKEVTIYFSDIRDFTKISEKINSSQELIKLLNLYMEPMSEEIIKTNGTIDKFIGDAIMAYWNAPLEVKEHANLAVKSAISQIDKLEKLNIQIQKQFNIKLNIGIGIHKGEVIVGEIGSKGRSDYTIIGDNVNLASRIEGLTKLFGAKILISQSVKNSLKDEYLLKKVGDIKVKGKDKPICLYKIILDNKKLVKEQEEEFLKALKYYHNENFHKAKKIFEALNEKLPCKINDYYINSCKMYLKNKDLKFVSYFSMDTK